MFVRNELATYLGKEFENSDTCNFSINIHMDYVKDVEVLNLIILYVNYLYDCHLK